MNPRHSGLPSRQGELVQITIDGFMAPRGAVVEVIMARNEKPIT